MCVVFFCLFSQLNHELFIYWSLNWSFIKILRTENFHRDIGSMSLAFSLWLCLYKLKHCSYILKVKYVGIKLVQSRCTWRKIFWKFLNMAKYYFYPNSFFFERFISFYYPSLHHTLEKSTISICHTTECLQFCLELTSVTNIILQQKAFYVTQTAPVSQRWRVCIIAFEWKLASEFMLSIT